MANDRVILRTSEEGFSVSCPGLPGCWSQGATEAEALENIQIAMREYIGAAEVLPCDGTRRIVKVAIH
jgi:predicted RNase H-like HicB family nuclease